MRNLGRTSATGTAIIIGTLVVTHHRRRRLRAHATLTNAVNDARPFDLMAVSHRWGDH